jgi:hypothetical protein
MRSLIDQLRQSEQRFTAKLARRRAELDAVGHLHWTDPLHQRLTAMLRNIRQELSSVETSLKRRAATAAKSS